MPHLSPSFVDAISELDDVVKLGHVRRDDEDVRLAGNLHQRLADLLQLVRGNVRNGDLEPLPWIMALG